MKAFIVCLLLGCGVRTDLSDQNVVSPLACPMPSLSDGCDTRNLGMQVCAEDLKVVFVCKATGWVSYESQATDNPRCDGRCR